MERFDVTYVGADGERHHPLLLHTSVSGSIDRVLYAILETQAMRMKKGKKARWPFWLAPTQVRILPISDDQLAKAVELKDKLPGRVDIDDRDEKLGRKIRDAEKEWVPLIVVLGKREVESGELNVRARSGEQTIYSAESLANHLDQLQSGMPSADLNQPWKLSERPIFHG